ncbi:MAG: flagellar protein FliT [Burkholderiaceae bacterium]|nr:flagellar protein FliT [Burkholderiaceae bacterium]
MRKRTGTPRMRVPSPSTPLLDRYRQIESVALEMLEAGRAGDWTRVATLETTIRGLADGIARDGGPDALDAEQRRERLRILRRLVLLDGDLRRLADPVHGWLDTMFEARPNGGGASRIA